jgi:spore maturation protein CgeB
MRWAIVGAYNLDSLEYHLHDTLTHMGHEARCFDQYLMGASGKTLRYWLGRVSPSFDESSTIKLADQILDFQPDRVIVVYRHIHPILVARIKEKRPDIITIHINPDHIATLEQQQIIAAPFDFYFTKEPFMQRFLRDKAGLNAYYLPESFNTRLHFPPTVDRAKLEKELNIDVLVFGNLYPYRVRMIEQLIRHNIRVTIFGAAGRYFSKSLRPFFHNRMITGADKAKHVLGARIVFNSFHFAEIEAANCKYFEIGGIGGFQICDYTAGLHEYSPLDPALYSFRSIAGAIELIRLYLHDQYRRYELADIQREHFLAHHTYEHRMESMLNIIEKSSAQNPLPSQT